MAAGPNGVDGLPHISPPFFGSSEEVEDGAIVPNVVGVMRKLGGGDIGGDPGDVCRCPAEARFCSLDGRFGKVEEGDVAAAASKEIVNERGFAPADINDGGKANVRGALDEGEGSLEMSAIPAERFVRFGGVDFFPMQL